MMIDAGGGRTVISPVAFGRVDWNELWQRRDLLLSLARRDVLVRYKQTALGASWAIIQPLLMMLVFTLIFGRLVKVPSEGHPYAVFVYAGLLPWGLFASVVNGAAMSVVSSQQLISKIYFPRLFIPLATVGGYLLDNLIATLLLIGLIAFYGLAFSPALLLWPLVVLLTVASSLGIGLYFAALNVSYRDFRYVIPFFLQFLLYATPVIYPLSILPESLRYIMYVNPMTGIIGASRSLFLGDPMPVLALAVAAVVSGALLYFGLRYYARVAQKFADVI